MVTLMESVSDQHLVLFGLASHLVINVLNHSHRKGRGASLHLHSNQEIKHCHTTVEGFEGRKDNQGLTGSRYPTRPDLFFNYPTRPVPKFENDRVAGN